MLPDAWKEEIVQAVNQAADRNAENEEARIESQNAIAAPLDRLANKFVSYQNETREREKGKRCREIATLWGLFINAAFVLATAIIFYCQLREMERVFIPIKQQAQAADDTYKAGNRAFVAYDGILTFPVKVEQDTVGWDMRPKFENTGNFPTERLTLNIRYLDRPAALSSPFKLSEFSKPVTGASVNGFIGPRASITGDAVCITVKQVEAIKDGRRHFYVAGWIAYDDGFKRRRLTEFCNKVIGDIADFGGNPNSGLGYRFCPQHNCADDECIKQDPEAVARLDDMTVEQSDTRKPSSCFGAP